MARRRSTEDEPQVKKDEKDTFRAEEFDDIDHMQKENRSAKMLAISLGVAVLAGVLSFLLMRAALFAGVGIHLYLPLVAPVICFGLVLFIFTKFGVDIKLLDWKKWLENGAMYILTWFVIWMLSMNPPFTDLASPVISKDIIQLDLESQVNISYIDYGGQRKMLRGEDVVSESETSPIESVNGIKNISVFVVVTDNWDVKMVKLSLHRLVQGEWTEMEGHSALNITIGRIEDGGSFEPSKREVRELKKVWSGGSEDVWEKNLYGLRMEVKDPTDAELRDQIDLKLVIEAKDKGGNRSDREVVFSFKVS